MRVATHLVLLAFCHHLCPFRQPVLFWVKAQSLLAHGGDIRTSHPPAGKDKVRRTQSGQERTNPSRRIQNSESNGRRKRTSRIGVQADPGNVTETVTLADLAAPPGKLWLPVAVNRGRNGFFQKPGGDPMSGILVAYCMLDMVSYHEKPWLFAMGNFLQKQSGCTDANKRTYRLSALADLVEDHPSVFMHPTGFIYHQTRCGSTLAANMLAAVPTNVVHSEVSPPVTVLSICGKMCSFEDTRNIVRTVLRLMSPAQSGHTHSFFKFQSSKFVKEMEAYWPEVKWVYLFRDPLEVMNSNLKGAWRKHANPGTALQQASPKKNAAFAADVHYNLAGPCARGFLKSRGGSHKPVTDEDVLLFCARYLQSLNSMALEQIKAGSPNGVAVEYRQLPEAITEYLYPVHFGLGTRGEGNREEDYFRWMEPVSHYYSKGMGKGEATLTQEYKQGMDLEYKTNSSDSVMQSVARRELCSTYLSLVALQSWRKENEGESLGTCDSNQQ